MRFAQLKVPAVIVVGLICFGGGMFTGVVTNAAFGEFWKTTRQKQLSAGELEVTPGPPPAMPGMPMAGGGRPRGPRAKNQLAALVVKLDVLTGKPLTLHLGDEQRAKLREQLAGLETKKELTEEEAKERLDAILFLVEKDRAALEAVGYRWPGQGGGIRPVEGPPNPFQIADNSKALQALRGRLASGASAKEG